MYKTPPQKSESSPTRAPKNMPKQPSAFGLKQPIVKMPQPQSQLPPGYKLAGAKKVMPKLNVAKGYTRPAPINSARVTKRVTSPVRARVVSPVKKSLVAKKNSMMAMPRQSSPVRQRTVRRQLESE